MTFSQTLAIHESMKLWIFGPLGSMNPSNNLRIYESTNLCICKLSQKAWKLWIYESRDREKEGRDERMKKAERERERATERERERAREERQTESRYSERKTAPEGMPRGAPGFRLQVGLWVQSHRPETPKARKLHTPKSLRIYESMNLQIYEYSQESGNL